MKIKSIIVTLLLTILCLSSCKSKEEKVISNLDNLYERIENNGSEFEAKDWEDALKEFADIHEAMKECNFSKEQLYEVAKKEGKLSAIFAIEGSKALGKELPDIVGNFATGIMESVEDISEVDISEVGDEISDAFKQLEDKLKE